MTISSYESTYEPTPVTSEDSMFGAPIYARRPKRQDRNNKIFIGAAAVGALAALGAVFWASSAANDRTDTPQVAAAQPLPASRAAPVPAQPVSTPVTPAVEPVMQSATPIRTAPAPRAAPAPAPRARVAAATAPSATDASADVSAREYAPVTATPPAAMEPAPAPMMADEPPASAPVLIIPE